MDQVCWVCRRDQETLIKELPNFFWSQNIPFFREAWLYGKVVDVDRRRDSDVQRNNTYVRGNVPEDRFVYHDPRRDLMITIQLSKISICQVCGQVVMGDVPATITAPTAPGIVMDDRARKLFRPMQAVSDQESLIDFIWNNKQDELKKLEAQFPQIEYRALLALDRYDVNVPIGVLMVQSATSLQPPQVIIALKNIQSKFPELGQFFEESAVFIFTREKDVKKMMSEIRERYLANPENVGIDATGKRP